MPLQLSHQHEPDAARLRSDLRTILDRFDVWGIIASASAAEVKPLRQALRGVEMPLLVTTDSTTVEGSERYPNELRLMPSNKAQATAMLFRANEASSVAEGSGAPLRIAPRIAISRQQSTHTRAYVDDLDAELHREAERLGIELDEFPDRGDHVGPVIAIGYEEHAKRLMSRRAPGRLTILSDGCATQKVSADVNSIRTHDKEYWYVARSKVPLQEVGSASFKAIVEAGRQLLESSHGDSEERDPRRRSLRDSIRRILFETSERHYKFEGIENVAAAYRVDPIADEQDLKLLPTPEGEDDESKASRRHGLRLVRSN